MPKTFGQHRGMDSQLGMDVEGTYIGLTDVVRNGDWRFGHQYELGAWRWAVLKVLPTLGLSAETIIYLMQVAPRGTRTR